MGLSFLKRKKKTKAGFILEDDDNDDHLHRVQPYKDVADKPILTTRGDINQQDNNEEDYSVSRYAVLQPASSYGYSSLSRSKRSQSQKSSVRSGGGASGATTPSSYISNKESSASSTRSSGRSSGVSTPIMRVETLPEEDEPSASAPAPAAVSPTNVANNDTPPSQKKTPIHSNLVTTQNNSETVGNRNAIIPKVDSTGNFSQYSLQYQQQFQQQQQENEAAEETKQEDDELQKKKKKKSKKSKKEKKKSKKKKEKKQTKQDSSNSKALATTITPTNVKKSSSPSMKHFFIKPSKHDTTAISHATATTIVSPDQSIRTREHDNSNTRSDISLGDVLLPSSPVVFQHNHLEEGLELQLLGTHTTANYGTSYGATSNGGGGDAGDGDGDSGEEEEEELVFHGRVLSADPSSFSIADTSVGNLVIEPTVAVAPALAPNNNNNSNSYAAQSFLRKRSTPRARSGLSSIMRKTPEVTNEQQLFGTTTTTTTTNNGKDYYATRTTTSERNPSELGTSAGIDVAAELGEPSRNLTSLFNSVSEDEDEMSTNKGATTTNSVSRNDGLNDTGIATSGVAVDTATDTVTVASQKSTGGGAGTSTSRKVGAESGLGYLSQNEKKFLSRLRRKGGNKLQQQQQQQHDASNNKNKKQQMSKQGSAALANNKSALAATAPSSDTVIAAIPEEITHDDQASMPSLLTEPEMIAKRRSRSSRGSSSRATSTRPYTPPATPTFPSNDQDDMVYSTNVRTQSIRFKNTTTTTTSSAAASDDNGERQQQRQHHHRSQSPPELTGVTSTEETEYTKTSQNNDGYTTFGGTTTRGGGGSYFGTTVASGISSATAAGGIEKLLNAFNCNEDTTTLSLLGGMLDGLKPLCGIMEEESAENRRKDGVDRMLEKEEDFALDFQRDIIKNGIKLIHHESPSRASTNPDWIQSTIKLFIRPGNCHTSHTTQQPKLAWAVLPVVSRMQLVGNFEHSNEEEAMWSTLGLLDVHSIMVDEGDATTSGGGGNYSPARIHKNGSATGSAGAGAAASSTGFFSITANNGAVHVFEAPSGKQRDYVVMGLRTIISRLAYHVIAGEPDVIGELYSEDAGQLTGELPSLVSPWKALSKVTHAFVDKQ